MNITFIGLATGVVLLGTATVLEGGSTGPAAPRVSVFAQDDLGTSLDARADGIRVSVEGELQLADAVEYLQDLTGTPVAADWPALAEAGITADTLLRLDHEDAKLVAVLGAIESQLDPVAPVEWIAGDMIELVPQEEADRRETLLATYVVGEIIEHIAWRDDVDIDSAKDALTDLIYEFVEPDAWVEMGGELAHMTIVGGKLFIEAPRRMHERIEWILAELEPVDEDELGAAPQSDPVGSARAEIPGEVLAPGDLVTVEVFEMYEPGAWYSLSRRLGPSGMFRYPMLGEVRAVGLTPRDFQGAIQESLAQLFADPQCTVLVGDERSSYTAKSGE